MSNRCGCQCGCKKDIPNGVFFCRACMKGNCFNRKPLYDNSGSYLG